MTLCIFCFISIQFSLFPYAKQTQGIKNIKYMEDGGKRLKGQQDLNIALNMHIKKNKQDRKHTNKTITNKQTNKQTKANKQKKTKNSVWKKKKIIIWDKILFLQVWIFKFFICRMPKKGNVCIFC